MKDSIQTATTVLLGQNYDETYSAYPFFQVYKNPGNKSVETSIKAALTNKEETLVASIFLKATEVQASPYRLVLFTNRRIISVIKSTGGWDSLWNTLGNLIEKVPIVGWVLAYLLDGLKGFIGSKSKRAYKIAEKIMKVDAAAFLDSASPKRRIARGMFLEISNYTKLLQPSLGISIRSRWFANYFGELRGTSIRFIPTTKIARSMSSLVDPAKYIIPEPSVIDKLDQFFDILCKSFDEFNIQKENPSANDLRLTWPQEIGEGSKRSSAVAATSIGFLNLLIALIVLFGVEESFLAFLVLGIFSLYILAQRKLAGALAFFGYEILLVVVGILEAM